jgi:PAS domain S-box-containing protein
MPSRLDQIYEELKSSSDKEVVVELPANENQFELDIKGNFLSVGQKALELTGFSEKQMSSMSVWDVIAEEDHDLMLEKFAPDRKVKSKESYEVTILSKDGQRVRIKVEIEFVFEGKRIKRIMGWFFPV